VSTYEWLLLLHVLSAFALVAALVVLAAAVLGARRSERPDDAAAFAALTRPATTLFSVAGLAVLVFGVWLAFEADYGLDEAWIIAAIVLWVVAAATGERAGRPYARARDRTPAPAAGSEAARRELDPAVRDRHAIVLVAVAATSVLAMLALMVFKPGAG
jgi:uncharacterized membrane protein